MKRLWPELALVGVAAAFALTFAGGSIWLDEAFSVQVAESGWPRFWALLRHDNGPPLYYAALKGWIAAFGDGERALRALSAALAVGAVAPAIALGRELSGTREGGLATGLLLACSAQLALHGRAARMYALVLLLAAVTTWLWARWVAGRASRWTLGLYALATALGAYTHYWFGFLTLAQLVTAALALRRASVPLWLAALVGWMPFAAWMPVLLEQLRNGSRAWIQPPGPWGALAALAGVLGRPASIGLAITIAFAFASAARRSGELERDGWRRRWAGTAGLVALALGVPWVISLWRPIFWPVRHAVIAAPAIAALLGVPLARLFRTPLLAAILAAVLVLRGATHLAEARAAAGREAGSDRAAAAYLASNAAPGDAVIAVGLSGPAIEYYLRRSGPPLEFRAFPLEMEEHPAWIDPSALAPAALEAEAASLEEALRGRPVWLVSVAGDPMAAGLRARLGARALARSARLDGLFYDRLERYLPR